MAHGTAKVLESLHPNRRIGATENSKRMKARLDGSNSGNAGPQVGTRMAPAATPAVNGIPATLMSFASTIPISFNFRKNSY